MISYPSGMELAPGDLSGTWAALHGRLIYREVPKAACSALAQVLYHADHGHFYAGDIHDATTGTLRWPFDRAMITTDSFVFAAVRNPYARIVSAYLDKVCTLQRDGKPYRNILRHVLTERYGVDLAGDPVRAFRRFLLFVRDVTLFRERFWYDRHWTAQVQHLRALPLNGVHYTHVFATEQMETGLGPVLARIPAPTRPGALPRFNATARPELPLAAWFDDMAIHLMQEVYRWDFDALGYDRFDPSREAPVAELDIQALNQRLSDPHAPHWAPVTV
jgi:hypothetical protein